MLQQPIPKLRDRTFVRLPPSRRANTRTRGATTSRIMAFPLLVRTTLRSTAGGELCIVSIGRGGRHVLARMLFASICASNCAQAIMRSISSMNAHCVSCSSTDYGSGSFASSLQSSYLNATCAAGADPLFWSASSESEIIYIYTSQNVI